MEILLLFAEIFARFFCVGLFSVGGGLATLPFLSDMGDATGWFTQADISNMVAISESTPGPIGINMATYIGYQIGSVYGAPFGILGSLIASVGEVAPSVIIIIIVSRILTRFKNSRYVEFAFYGLRAASLGLVCAALLSVTSLAWLSQGETLSFDNFFMSISWQAVALSVLVFYFAQRFKKLHPVALIVVAAAVGIIFKM